jgi:hypothetical protein
VYPQKTKEELASSTVEDLMNERGIKEVLGTVRKIAKGQPEAFYRALQNYVDRFVLWKFSVQNLKPSYAGLAIIVEDLMLISLL